MSDKHGILHVIWPAAIALAADWPYWQRLRETAKAGGWLTELWGIGGHLAAALGTAIVLLDLGDIGVEIVDGAPKLISDLVVSQLPDG